MINAINVKGIKEKKNANLQKLYVLCLLEEMCAPQVKFYSKYMNFQSDYRKVQSVNLL